MLLARSSPGGLALATDPRFLYPRHIELLDSLVVDAIAGEVPPRLIVEAPPRHGKSNLYSKYLPAWFIGTYPDKRVMFGSYEADFAAEWGGRARGILEETGAAIFGVGVEEDSRAKYRWDATRTFAEDGTPLADAWATPGGGGMMTAGVGGAFTGKGADLLIIDDPIKNREQAESERYREKTWEWWQSAVYTRLEPGAVAIVIMARWHQDDLIGRLLEADEEWYRIRLPALAEKDDVLGREVGEALWPERYDEEDFARMRKEGAVGSYAFEGLYQCRPSPPEGGIFQRSFWRYYTEPPPFDEVIESWDMAFKDKADSDFVVGQVWGRNGANKYLLAEIRARLDFSATKEAVKALAAWTDEHYRQENGARLVEDKANGTAVINELRDTVPGLIAVEPKGGKEARAHAVSPQIEAGNVHLPEGVIPCPVGALEVGSRTVAIEQDRTEDFVEECAAFPNAANDDRVDAMTQALSRLKGEGGFVKPRTV